MDSEYENPVVVEEPIVKTSLKIEVKDTKGNQLKTMNIDRIDYTKTRIKMLKRAMNKYYSIHPSIKNIEFRVNDSTETSPLDDDALLSEIGEFENIYALIKIPFSLKSFFTQPPEIVQKVFRFIRKYLLNLTLITSIFLYYMLAKTTFYKIVFGFILTFNYLVECEVISLQFTYRERVDSLWKPLWTIVISLYPTWDQYNPLDNNFIEYKEPKEEKNDDENGVEENNNDNNHNDNHDHDDIEEEVTQTETTETETEENMMTIRQRIGIEDEDKGIETQNVDHSTSDDEE